MNIFITGGLTGMGRELALSLQADGHHVAISSFQEIEEIKEQIPDGISYYQADVRDVERMKLIINDFKATFGSLDVVYANAGINHPKSDIPDWERCRDVVDINIKGVINTVAPAIEIMKQQGSGQIVTIASISAYAGLPGMSVYGSTKAFIKNFSETLSVDLAQYGIKVTMVAPGFVLTPLTENNPHKMPFLIDQKQAAKEIKKAIYKKKEVHVFPLPMTFISKLLYFSPRAFYRRVLAKLLGGLKSH
jgi:NAD(P)-dependent dehydrogenase (short-subunit alcohol dehydrogenase family)